MSETFPRPPAKSPTTFVSYNDKSVKARIDPQVPLKEILRQLVASTQLGISEPAALFCLRTVSGELITPDNLSLFLDSGQPLVLTASPVLEAVEMVEKLNSIDPGALKLAAFSLQTLIKEPGFRAEFLARGGFEALQNIIKKSNGNTLAYALLSVQNLLSDVSGWQGLGSDFVARIVQIIAKEPLINISRPATAILRHLCQTPVHPTTQSAKNKSVQTGFRPIYTEIQKQPEFFKLLVGRLVSGDVAVAMLSLGLINSLYRGSIETGETNLSDELERLGTWALVGSLFDNERSGGRDLSPYLTFQGNIVSSLHMQLVTRVDQASYRLFDNIWECTGLEDADETFRWRRVGYLTENPQLEYEHTGVLGLKTFSNFASARKEQFAAAIHEQQSKPEERQCPFAVASSSVLETLAAHFHITTGLSQTPTVFKPFLFKFYELHSLGTLLYMRLWAESGATRDEYQRINKLVGSHLYRILNEGFDTKSWAEIESEFKLDYRMVREKQIKNMEVEDEFLVKPSVRNVRDRLYRESYEFIKNQRLYCLHEGAWFLNPQHPAIPAKSNKRQPSTPPKVWKFCRLSANRKTLHYLDSDQIVPIKNGIDDLTGRIDVSLVTDIAIGDGEPLPREPVLSIMNPGLNPPRIDSAPPQQLHKSSDKPKLTITLLAAEGSLLEVVAPTEHVYSEWVDGLSFLRPDGVISTQETASFVSILSDIGVKIKLLDLSGEKVDLPNTLTVGQAPLSTDFHYADGF